MSTFNPALRRSIVVSLLAWTGLAVPLAVHAAIPSQRVILQEQVAQEGPGEIILLAKNDQDKAADEAGKAAKKAGKERDKEEKQAEKEDKKYEKLVQKCAKHPDYKKCPASRA